MDTSRRGALERGGPWLGRLLGSRPVRAARLFASRNGPLLSSGMSYQALFASFAALYLALLLAGQWVLGDSARLERLIELSSSYVPGLLGEDAAVESERLRRVAERSAAQLGWGSALAIAALLWTALGWITASRLAIRSIFGLAKDERSVLLLKAGDLLAALGFGAALLTGVLLTTLSTRALEALFELLGIGRSLLLQLLAGGLGLALVLLLDALVLAAMFWLLAGAILRARFVLEGALLGGLGLLALQLLGSSVVTGVRSNPLLAGFVVLVALLLWFRLTSVITLLAAAWVAERAESAGRPIRPRPRRAVRRARAARAKRLRAAR